MRQTSLDRLPSYSEFTASSSRSADDAANSGEMKNCANLERDPRVAAQLSHSPRRNVHIERVRQQTGIDVEVVVGVVPAGERVGVTTVAFDQLRVLVLARILEKLAERVWPVGERDGGELTFALPMKSMCSRK